MENGIPEYQDGKPFGWVGVSTGWDGRHSADPAERALPGEPRDRSSLKGRQTPNACGGDTVGAPHDISLGVPLIVSMLKAVDEFVSSNVEEEAS
jgi:hypothetical protein